MVVRKKSIALFGFFLGTVILVYFLLPKPVKERVSVPVQNVVNSIPLGSTRSVAFLRQNDSVKLQNISQTTLSQKLMQLKVIDGKTVKSVTIIISNQNVDSMYSQADSSGKDFVSSKYAVDTKGNATITMYAGNSFFTFPKEQQAKLFNYYFWKVADLMSIRNTHIKKENADHIDVFSPAS